MRLGSSILMWRAATGRGEKKLGVMNNDWLVMIFERAISDNGRLMMNAVAIRAGKKINSKRGGSERS